MTTDGAGNFKSALKRHGDDYETFDQLIKQIDEYEEELFEMDFDDLNAMWCPSNELLDDNSAGVMPLTDDSDDDSIENIDPSHENFRIEPVPDEIVKQVLDDLGEKNVIVLLPSRIDCSAHNLNLIGKSDSFKAMRSDHLYASRYISVFKKLNAIWKTNSTRHGRELFQQYLKKFKIQKPHRIRWNRIQEAVRL